MTVGMGTACEVHARRPWDGHNLPPFSATSKTHKQKVLECRRSLEGVGALGGCD